VSKPSSASASSTFKTLIPEFLHDGGQAEEIRYFLHAPPAAAFRHFGFRFLPTVSSILSSLVSDWHAIHPLLLPSLVAFGNGFLAVPAQVGL
jgi:hypothetical protein